jgi:hypothetical protein
MTDDPDPDTDSDAAKLEAIACDPVLADVLVGLRSLDDPEVRARLAEAPWLAAPLQELLAEAEACGDAGHQVRAEWAAAAKAVTAADRAAAAAFVGASLGGRPSPRRWRFGVAAAVAVAVITALGSWWFTAARDPGTEPVRLNSPAGTGREDGRLHPDGTEPFGEHFTWSAGTRRGGWYVVRVYAADAAADAAPLFVSGELLALRWQPEAAIRARIRALRGFRWEVSWTGEDGEGGVIGRATVRS